MFKPYVIIQKKSDRYGARMKLLIVIDMQNDFIDGALGTKEAVKIVPNVAAKIREYRESGGNCCFYPRYASGKLSADSGRQKSSGGSLRGRAGRLADF